MKLKLSHNHRYANLLPRFVARSIDSGLFSSLFFTVTWLYSRTLTIDNLGSVLIGFLTFWVLPYIFICIVYFPLMHSRYGATIGQLILGLRVEDKSGKFLKFRQALFRHLIAVIPINMTFGLGYLSIAFDPNHQGWHDQFTGSFVTIRHLQLVRGLIVLAVLIAALAAMSYLTVTSVLSLINPSAL